MSDLKTADAPRKWWAQGLTNLIIVLALTFGGWYLLNDPVTSPLDVLPLHVNAALFWALLFVVWSGFNLELVGFTRLPQPLRGLTITAATAILAIAVTSAPHPGSVTSTRLRGVARRRDRLLHRGTLRAVRLLDVRARGH